MDDKFKLVLNNVQRNATCHQKYLRIVKNIYDQMSEDDFIIMFFKHLRIIFKMDIVVKNPYVERSLEFLAQFVCSFIKPIEDEPELSPEEDLPSHPFLTEVIKETLKYHDLDLVQVRYHSCYFITLILEHIGYDIHLDGNICDAIQVAMIERTLDPKPSIRLQSVMALVRLQDPHNPDCSVIKAYQPLLADANPSIRKEVVKIIAPTANTRPQICDRIRDVDYRVRITAYLRCADLGPMLFKIVIRQKILKCGFLETNSQVKKVFLENLLPKWLSAYNGDYLKFLSGIKLDADETDILCTEEISKQVMETFFKSHSIRNIIEYLPLDNSKLIPEDSLTSEVISYWNIVANYLRSSEDTEEFIDEIMPELTPFCIYIQKIIESNKPKKMKEWEYLDFQYILYNLFDMAERCDLADEVGRKTLCNLILRTLQQHKLQFNLVKKCVIIVDKLMATVDILCNEVCQIISDIREPLVDDPTMENNCELTFQVAERRVRENILQGELEDALDNKEFSKAAELQAELKKIREKPEQDKNKPLQASKVRVLKEDSEIICRCLDILAALLMLPNVKDVLPSLTSCKNEFLLPLLLSNIVEIHWRVLRCIALYCILDRSIAEEHIEMFRFLILTYRTVPNYNKSAVINSVSALCDMMRVYGSEICAVTEDVNSTVSTQNTTRRKLYRNEDAEDLNHLDCSRMNVEFIIEIILDMLDDEIEDIRDIAMIALTKLILNDFPVTPMLMSRLILRWFNPMAEKSGDKIQQMLGFLITNYTKLIRGSREIIEEAVIPTLNSIANAPRSSPLADVDIENVLRFLAAITDSNDAADITNIHEHLARSLCMKIASKPSDPLLIYLSKMLLHLNMSFASPTTIKELITQVEGVLGQEEDSLNKGPRKLIIKFIERLRAIKEQFNRLNVITENAEESENDKNKEVDGKIADKEPSISDAEIQHDTTEKNCQNKIHEGKDNKKDNSSKNLKNKNDHQGSNTSGKKREYRKRVSKPLCGSEKEGHQKMKSLDTNSSRQRCRPNRSTKNPDSGNTTDQEVEGTGRELRSKRIRPNLSQGSEKENSVNVVPLRPDDHVNNNLQVQLTRSSTITQVSTRQTDPSFDNSQPLAESSRINSYRTLRSGAAYMPLLEESETNVTGVKRRKSRGKKSQDLNSTKDTTLHTIVEQSQRMEILDDTTIQTPSSNTSSSKSLQLSHSRNTSLVFSTPSSVIPQARRVIVSETSSDSESGSSTSLIRKSTRKIKKKNMENHIL